jgi:hypothetical protein
MRIGERVCRVRAVIDGVKVEPGPIKASEAEKLLAWTGYGTIREWELRTSDGDVLGCRALLALMEFRKGNNVRFADVDIIDIDSICADLVDDRGRVVTVALDDQAEPVMRAGKPVWLFDGEEEPDPPQAASPTG